MGKDFRPQGQKDFAPKKDFKSGGVQGQRPGGKPSFQNRGGQGGGGFNRNQPQGPPESVQETCEFSHVCGKQIVLLSTQNQKVPKFNKPIYLENKTRVGTIDEIFGPISGYMFSAELIDGIKPESFKKGDKFYMDQYNDCLPLDRFLPRPPGAKKAAGGFGGAGRGGRGGARGGPRGGSRGGPRGGPRGGSRGGPRGGFRGGR